MKFWLIRKPWKHGEAVACKPQQQAFPQVFHFIHTRTLGYRVVFGRNPRANTDSIQGNAITRFVSLRYRAVFGRNPRAKYCMAFRAMQVFQEIQDSCRFFGRVRHGLQPVHGEVGSHFTTAQPHVTTALSTAKRFAGTLRSTFSLFRCTKPFVSRVHNVQ
jgi:hypothetical protein